MLFLQGYCKLAQNKIHESRVVLMSVLLNMLKGYLRTAHCIDQRRLIAVLYNDKEDSTLTTINLEKHIQGHTDFCVEN